jgi:hypothetical protein
MLIDAKLQTGKRGHKMDETARSPLRVDGSHWTVVPSKKKKKKNRKKKCKDAPTHLLICIHFTPFRDET